MFKNVLYEFVKLSSLHHNYIMTSSLTSYNWAGCNAGYQSVNELHSKQFSNCRRQRDPMVAIRRSLVRVPLRAFAGFVRFCTFSCTLSEHLYSSWVRKVRFSTCKPLTFQTSQGNLSALVFKTYLRTLLHL